MDSFYERHVLHSLAISKVINFHKGAQILDVGTGGGFPGIPLAIIFPEVEFHLVDSIAKKIKVVKAISEELELHNVKAEQSRAEELKKTYDFVVSRAVTRLNRFIPWVDKKIRKGNAGTKPNGMLFLKGGDLDEEIKEVNRMVISYDLKEFFEEEFFETKKILYLSS